MSHQSKEHLLDQTLRRMQENLSGAYSAVYPPKHEKEGKPCTNSGTCIIICCYMNSLGKILLKGAGTDKKRFLEFIERCMPDFREESAKKQFPPTRKGRLTGQDWLYEEFRCGFVHSFYPGETAAWSRFPNDRRYWKEVGSNRVVLNITALMDGFIRGIENFRRIVDKDPDLRLRFKDYILAVKTVDDVSTKETKP